MNDDIEYGARAHYEDAIYYDQAYRRRRHDVRWYVEQATTHGGPVLELGCGTGRVSVDIADAGIELVGVDRMQPMLDRAMERATKRPKRVRANLEWQIGDLREIRLERKFPLIISPFNTWMHLYTREDFEQACATVLAHLADGGLFCFDVLMPDVRALARDPAKVYRVGKSTLPATGRRYHYRERFDFDALTGVQTIDLAWVGIDDPTDFHLVPLTHRHFFPEELRTLLHYNGLDVLRHEADFDGDPLHSDAESQLVVCQRR